MSDLLEKLREVQGKTTKSYRNPEGPEAADRIEELEMELMCCGDARGLDGMEYERRIAKLESEHGDMNVHCVKLEKENERLRAALEHCAVRRLCSHCAAAVQETDDKYRFIDGVGWAIQETDDD